MLDEKQRKLVPHMLHELDTPSKTLSSWEEGFIASVSNQWDARGTLSDRQFETLERIYADKTE